jgi:hypothetical protein
MLLPMNGESKHMLRFAVFVFLHNMTRLHELENLLIRRISSIIVFLSAGTKNTYA